MKSFNSFKQILFFALISLACIYSCHNKVQFGKTYSKETQELSIDTAKYVPYRQGSTWFYVNRQKPGNYAGFSKAFECEFDEAFPFNENDYACVVKNNLTGCIDTTGKTIIPIEYKSVTPCIKEKLFIITNQKKLMGVCDVNGNIIIPIQYKAIEVKEKRIVTCKTKHFDGICELFDVKGNCLIDSQKEYYGLNILNLTDYKVMPYGIKSDNLVLYGLLNEIQDVVLKPTYNFIGNFFRNRALVKKDNKFGFIDKNGKLIIPMQYDYAYSFLHNYYTRIKINNKEGIIDTTGTILIPPDYNEFYIFDEDSAHIACRKGNKYGIINLNADIIIPFEYDNIGLKGFRNNLTPAKKDNKWGVIDKNNKTIVDFKYDFIDHSHYENSVFIFEREGLTGIIDNSNSEIIKPTYDNQGMNLPRFISANRIVATLPDTYNQVLINRKGESIIDKEFSIINEIKYGLIKVYFYSKADIGKQSKKTGYIDVFGKMYFED